MIVISYFDDHWEQILSFDFLAVFYVCNKGFFPKSRVCISLIKELSVNYL